MHMNGVRYGLERREGTYRPRHASGCGREIAICGSDPLGDATVVATSSSAARTTTGCSATTATMRSWLGLLGARGWGAGVERSRRITHYEGLLVKRSFDAALRVARG